MVRVWLTMIDSGAVEETALLQAEDKGKVEAYSMNAVFQGYRPWIWKKLFSQQCMPTSCCRMALVFFFLLGGKQSPLVVHHLLSSLSVCSSSSRSSHLFNPVWLDNCIETCYDVWFKHRGADKNTAGGVGGGWNKKWVHQRNSSGWAIGDKVREEKVKWFGHVQRSKSGWSCQAVRKEEDLRRGSSM